LLTALQIWSRRLSADGPLYFTMGVNGILFASVIMQAYLMPFRELAHNYLELISLTLNFALYDINLLAVLGKHEGSDASTGGTSGQGDDAPLVVSWSEFRSVPAISVVGLAAACKPITDTLRSVRVLLLSSVAPVRLRFASALDIVRIIVFVGFISYGCFENWSRLKAHRFVQMCCPCAKKRRRISTMDAFKSNISTCEAHKPDYDPWGMAVPAPAAHRASADSPQGSVVGDSPCMSCSVDGMPA